MAQPDCFLVLPMPDVPLNLIFSKPDGDLTVGFEGYEWHTHGSILRAEYEVESDEVALGHFINDLYAGRLEVVLIRTEGSITDAWMTSRKDSATYQDPHSFSLGPGERLEVRGWQR